MYAYIMRRLLMIIPTLFFVTIIVFTLIRIVPGDAVDLMVARMAFSTTLTQEELAMHFRDLLGLDVPVHIQYVRWLSDAIQGDLGKSLWSDRLVATELLNKLPITLELGVFAISTVIILGLPIGTYSAIRQNTLGDYAARTFAVTLISLPSFWVATMVIVLPAIWLHWSPPVRYIPLVEDLPGNLAQFILPGFILGMALSGTTMRLSRTMMLEVLRQDYVRTAWAKGLSERTVVLRHALKNALIPVVSEIGVTLPIMIAGSIVIEVIFCLPGIGFLLMEAINKRDYPIISGINLLVSVGVLLINLVIDLSYAYLDPRIRYT